MTVPVFQSTLPRGERHLPQTRCPENVYFNPRSREGSDEDVTTKVDSLEISIHAPARGATVDPFFGSLDHVISIHAPARGATFGTLRSIPAASLFQSTLPRGERLLCGANLKLVIQFQSTLPRGERLSTGRVSESLRRFQSTLPRGERRIKTVFSFFQIPFQSTLPRGERHRCTHCVHARHCISIHAPARGATIRNHANCFLFCISIHAPARGATLLRRDHSALRNISIHAPARGATRMS